MNYTDQSLMPWGMHKGSKLANVPASYLVYLYENNLKAGPLKTYIEGNLEHLRMEAKMNAKQNRR